VGISFNTGASNSANTSLTCTVAIPAGVNVGDLMVLGFTVFNEVATAPTIGFSGGGGSWTLLSPMTTGSNPFQEFSGGVLYAYGYVYTRVATSGDQGATLTLTETGSPAGTTWWAVVLGSYTGAASAQPDVAGSAGVNNATTGVSPSETTGVAGDWSVQMLLGGTGTTGTPAAPGALTTRESVKSSAGVSALLADSGASVGGAGTGIGNQTWTGGNSAGNNTWTVWTIGLEPAAAVTAGPAQASLFKGAPAAVKGSLTRVIAPPPVIHPSVPSPFYPPHGLLRGPAGRVLARLTGLAAPAAPVQAASFNPSPQPQPGGRAWRARFRRHQDPWLQPGPPPAGAAPATVIPPPLRGPAAAGKGKLTGLAAPPPAHAGPAAPFTPPRGLLRGPAGRVLARLTRTRGRPGVPAPFTVPAVPSRGPAAARPGKLTGLAAPPPVLHPAVASTFKLPGYPLHGPGAARKGTVAGVIAPPPVLHPAVASTFKLPGYPLHGPAAARKGGVAGVVAPPPVTQPNIPAPFTPPHLLLRGPVPAAPRTKTTGAVAPPPAPPPVAPPHWQGSTHMIAATATGNLIQGANHTGRGGPGTDLKGDYERSGD
jgi:hypothetical protein